MRRTGTALVVALLGLVLATAAATTSASLRRPAAPVAAASTSDVLGSLPLSFEPLADGAFASRGPGYSLTLTPAEAVLGVRGGTFRLRPAGAGANPGARLVGRDPLAGTVTRLVGDDPAAWRAAVPTYGRVEAREVWPGVDMVWHGDQRRLEHDMVVSPGADPAVVALDVDGARSLALDAGGDLLVDLDGSAARLARPVLYQDVAGQRREVPGEFALLGPSRIGFRVGAYDTGLPLVIDPTLVTSTFLGGSGNDSGYAVAVDSEGNTYVTGSTESADFPTAVPYQGALPNTAAGPTSDAFVSKFSADGSRLVWSTYLGGGGRDTGYSVAVGADGAVLVSGVTESPDFPRAQAAQQAYGGGASDAFVAKIAATGTTLQWSTFVGGTQADRARGVAVDPAGNAYLTGSTNSVNFPAVNPHQPGPFQPDDLDAFLVKVPAAGAPLAFATRLGGDSDDRGLAVAVDGQGNAYVTGDTMSPAFPTVRPIQATFSGGTTPDAFVAKYNPAGSALVYSTFLGGGDFDQGTSIAVDAAGAAYVAGNTNSANFPTVAPLQPRKEIDADAFVAKLDGTGAALVYSTYVGGSGADGANGISVDGSGNAHVVGTTGSANWPANRAVQAAKGGGDDAFVLKLNASGASSLFSSFVGGREADAGMGIALDAQGRAHVLGLTGSADFPSVKPFQGSRPAAGGDAFVATLDLADPATPAPTTAAAARAAPASSSSSAHDRRVRMLGALTFALLLAAVAQTVYLRRRAPAPVPVAAKAPPKPKPKPSAAPGLKVLDQTRSGPATTSTPAKAGAGAGAKSTRKPKTRGGPKGGGPQKAEAGAAPATGDTAGDGGPPTVATPPPPAPKPTPQKPAVAQLLEEDVWAPEPAADEPAALPEPAAAPEELEEPAALRTDPGPGAGAEPSEPVRPLAAAAPPAPQPPAAIPPVPAEELSFWDLFPEDLPPARPATAPVEDILVDHLALPEGPDSVAGRMILPEGDELVAPDVPPADPTDPQPSRPPHPPDAEIVIAELLDGPLPTGLRASAESPWAPQEPSDDFLIDDLLADHAADAARQEGRGHENQEGDAPDDQTRPRKDEQARIAADRARRRRRSRGSGRRKQPGSG